MINNIIFSTMITTMPYTVLIMTRSQMEREEVR